MQQDSKVPSLQQTTFFGLNICPLVDPICPAFLRVPVRCLSITTSAHTGVEARKPRAHLASTAMVRLSAEWHVPRPLFVQPTVCGRCFFFLAGLLISQTGAAPSFTLAQGSHLAANSKALFAPLGLEFAPF